MNWTKLVIASIGSVGSSAMLYSMVNRIKTKHCHILKKVDEFWQNQDERILFLCPLRDPVSRNLSFFFQMISCTQQDHFENADIDRKLFVGQKEIIADLSTLELMAKFRESTIHDQILVWLDKLSTILDLDLEQLVDRGDHYVLEHPRHCFIFYAIENASHNAIIGQYLDPSWTIKDSNKAETKWYFSKYQAVIKNIKFEKEYLDRFYQHPIIKKVYGDLLAEFYQKWNTS